MNKINKNKIKINDIKIQYHNSSLRNEILTDLFKGDFKLVHYNPLSYLTVIKKYSDKYPLSIFINPYLNEKDSKDIKIK